MSFLLEIMQRTGLKVTSLTLVVICLASIISCSPLYIPSGRLLNHFETNHELNGAAMIDFSGFEGRAAGSLTNHIMVQTGYSKSIDGLANDRDTTSIDSHEGSHNHHMFEIGAGYFGKIFGRYAEFSGGFSNGRSDAFEDIPSHDGALPRSSYPESRVIRGAYDRFFLQGGVALIQRTKVRLGFGVRIATVKFYRIESQTQAFTFDTKNRFYFLEPSADLMLNIKDTPVYLLANVGFSRRIDSLPRQRTNRGSVPEFWQIKNAIGVGIHINNRRSNQNEK